MKNPTQMTWKASAALLLGLCLLNSNALAAEAPVPLKTMSQEEYAIYRQKLDLQVKDVAAGTAGQNSAAVEKEPEAASEPESGAAGSGYGKGYRARMERSGGAGRAGGYRSGSMSRGGGGRNR